MQAPTLDGVWPGRTLIVSCLTELSYKTEGGAPARPVVAGSSRVEGDVTIYRPQLSCMVVGYQIARDEWGAAIGWDIELEEI
jgi:hypothetical protein